MYLIYNASKKQNLDIFLLVSDLPIFIFSDWQEAN